MLLARITSAVVLIPAVLAALYFGGWVLLGVVLGAVIIGSYELGAMFRASGQRLPLTIVISIAVGIVASAALRNERVVLQSLDLSRDLLPAVLFLGTLALLAGGLWRPLPPLELCLSAALGLLGALYLGGFLSFALLLRALPTGLEWAFAAVVTTWAADTGAFFAGRRWGRHRLCPRISPGKTWEGVVGGLVLGVLAALLSPLILPQLTVWLAIAFGLLVTVAAVAGDLIESLLKRAAGVKDSGAIIPGHGGLLDRIDSLLLVFPVTYYFAVAIHG